MKTRLQIANEQLAKWDRELEANPPPPRKLSLARLQEIAESEEWENQKI